MHVPIEHLTCCEIKTARLNSGTKQLEIARQLGIAVHTYSQKECGRRDFTVSEYIKIKKILNF